MSKVGVHIHNITVTFPHYRLAFAQKKEARPKPSGIMKLSYWEQKVLRHSNSSKVNSLISPSLPFNVGTIRSDSFKQAHIVRGGGGGAGGRRAGGEGRADDDFNRFC